MPALTIGSNRGVRMSYGIGQPVPRTEDPRLLTGRGTYVDDIVLPRMAHAVIVYASIAHADIRTIDVSAAADAPGVLAVLTGDDIEADNLGGITPNFMPEDMGGPKGHRTARPLLAQARVRYVGERVALVVAETRAQARDAAELVAVDYAPRPAVVATDEAVKPGAPVIHDGAPGNIAFTIRNGSPTAEVATAMDRAHHVTRLTLYNNRLAANSMEPRGCIADWNVADERCTVYSSTQAPHTMRATLANRIFRLPESRFRIVARDVGGGFGMKGGVHPEEPLMCWASRRVGRPVKWIPERSEGLVADDQGRDQRVEAELALDTDGTFLALRWTALHNCGAWFANGGNVPITHSIKLAPSIYAIPLVDASSSMVFTNTAPTAPYRGAGRPEAIYIIERLIDRAARELGIDRIELRRRNLLEPGALPYRTATGYVIDSGDCATTFQKALDLADVAGFPARRQASAEAGKRRGLGIAYYMDNCGNNNERMELRFDPSGSLTILAGTFSHGQGHQTVYAQMVSDWLGVPFDSIRLEQGDTAAVAFGRGTMASRSMVVGGSALRAAADDLIANGRKLAAHLMEADESDIEFADGKYRIAGTDRTMGLIEVAKAAYRPAGIPAALGLGLEGEGAWGLSMPSFPNGGHVCEIEIDPDTGAAKLDRYTVVDDIGLVLNPLLVAGQIQGGVAQGIGQALLEDVHYDPESGQQLSGSFLDYCMPRADDVPTIATDTNEVPCKSNPLGVKGCGEGGTVGATPAVVSAILDALGADGVTDIQIPATPERIWQAIRSARKE
jgi:carbon-monoxide dehydrogenase large subunit